jgi:hypothetical protein
VRDIDLIDKLFLQIILHSFDIQHNNQKNNDLQNITYKTKDRVTQTQLIPGVTSGAQEG